MRSHELARELLSRPDVELLLQVDPEGNGYDTVHGVDFDVVVEIDGHDIEVFSTKYNASEHCKEEDEWEQLKATGSNKYAVVFP